MPTVPSILKSVKTLSFVTVSIFMALWSSPALADAYDVSASTYLGGAGDDSVKGVRIQSNGTLVIAANIGSSTPGALSPLLLNGATADTGGCILRFEADGQTVISITRIAEEVRDLAIDEADNIFVAAGTNGLIALDPDAQKIRWVRENGTNIHRIDAAFNGDVVAHKPGSNSDPDSAAGAGTSYLYDHSGDLLASFSGYRNTTDVCLDASSQTVVQIGWRQTNASDGSSTNPVQIAYLRGLNYDGSVKWLAYDWASGTSDPRFLNRYTNNMADTRGYRCSMGRDGKLYAAFECAGGNHIFRWSTQDLNVSETIVGGDRWHEFYNTKSEHKTFFARYEVATGEYLLGQQLVTRISNSNGNTIRVRRGEIRADALGRVYIGGASASGLPIPGAPFYSEKPGQIAFNPPVSSYTGGSWLMVLSPDFSQRRYTTRLTAGGEVNAIDARILGGEPRIAWGGRSDDPLHLVAPVQPDPGGEDDGFLSVLTEGLEYDGLAAFRALHFTPEELADPAAEATLWGDQADADGDGNNTLIEYFAATDPRSSDAPLPAFSLRPDGRSSLLYRRSKTATLNADVMASGDLQSWSPAEQDTRAVEDLGEAYLFESILDAPTPANLFLRLRIR